MVVNGKKFYVDIGNKNLEQIRRESSETPVVVVFTADWLGASQIVDTYVRELATAFQPDIRFYRHDMEQDGHLSQEMGISRYPTIVIFRDGEIIDFFSGIQSRQKIRLKLEAL